MFVDRVPKAYITRKSMTLQQFNPIEIGTEYIIEETFDERVVVCYNYNNKLRRVVYDSKYDHDIELLDALSTSVQGSTAKDFTQRCEYYIKELRRLDMFLQFFIFLGTLGVSVSAVIPAYNFLVIPFLLATVAVYIKGKVKYNFLMGRYNHYKGVWWLAVNGVSVPSFVEWDYTKDIKKYERMFGG